ncbi:MAG TPA: substrate-binding domain-containing protein, partial [Chloroflexia bacterium]|nr:substrate-binding domain-containing protein [Chloroflexia bacterium]
MPWSHLRRLAALSLALLLVACTSAAPPTTPVPIALTIFAASSLNEAMTAVEAGFRAATPGTPPAQFNFAGSQALLAQLKQGASADLFITADAPTMDAARTAGLVL